jgi:hypothetical protein
MTGYTTKCRGERGFCIVLKLRTNLLRIGMVEYWKEGIMGLRRVENATETLLSK